MNPFLDNSPHCMIDLETLGTKPGCVVFSLGACVFNAHGVHDAFYRIISVKPQLAVDLRVNPDTLGWWMTQDEGARRELTAALVGGGQPGEVLDEFNLWFRTRQIGPVWGNGAGFDQPILTTMYQRFGREVPWKFSNERCFRTLKNLFPEVQAPASTGTHHNALDDAVWQANYAVRINSHVSSRRDLQSDFLPALEAVGVEPSDGGNND